jgi:hypothetical protein
VHHSKLDPRARDGSDSVIRRCRLGVRFAPRKRTQVGHLLRSELCEQRTSRRLFITLSAMASSEGGRVRPSIRAVEALMARSNLLDCTTGRFAGVVVSHAMPAIIGRDKDISGLPAHTSSTS